MELFENIRKISFWFFVTMGLIHFLTGLLYVNNYFTVQAGIINRVTFIPFFVATYTYFYAQLKCHIIQQGRDRRWISGVLIAIGMAIFIVMLGVEIGLVDDPTPLIR